MIRYLHPLVVAACMVALVTVTGCAGPSSHAAKAPTPPRTIGGYPVDRFSYPGTAGAQGPLVEAMRMSRALVPTVRIAPSLTEGRYAAAFTTPDDAVKKAGLAQDDSAILDRDHMIAGYAASSASALDPAGATEPAPTTTAVSVALMRFPDDHSASDAANGLAQSLLAPPDGFDRLTLPGHSAVTAGRGHSGLPRMEAFVSVRQFVLRVYIVVPDADTPTLATWGDQALTLELPAIESFRATPTNTINTQPIDPDHLLARALTRNRQHRVPDPDTFATYGPEFLVDDSTSSGRVAGRLTDPLLQRTGTDALAFVDSTVVFRTRDEASARDLATGLIAEWGGRYRPSPGPAPAGIQCQDAVAQPDPQLAHKCYITVGRYVAVVNATATEDFRQAATAQQALLTNNA